MDLRLQDRVALVTGGAKGLGLACRRRWRLMGMTLDEARRRESAAIPLGRFAAPQEVADVVTFPCPDRPARVTGVTIGTDGARSPTL